MKLIGKPIIFLFITMSLYTISAFGFKCPKKNAKSNPNALYANSEDCCSFYQCAHGHAYLMKCPEGLQWSTKLLRCEWPENSDCGASNGFKCPKENDEKNPNGLYANPDDCTKFFQCAHGYAYLMNCPEGLQWSTKLLRCEWQENSDCGVKH